MKYTDVEKMLEAGLISQEQAKSITAHFNLTEGETSRFLTIVLYIGAALVACGIILLIASNWDAIPRAVKIGGGISLMVGAYAAGWFLRETPGYYPKSGEALFVVGAGFFLANIALVGQVYHLSSRLPNAFLLWWVGIAALPWALRSKGLHVLSLAAFSIWFGTELNQESSPMYVGDEGQLLMYALLGLSFLGFGYLLRGTRYEDFAPPTEKLGVTGLIACSIPLMWGVLPDFEPEHSGWAFPVMLVLAVVCVVAGTSRRRELTGQWRWTWAGSLIGLALLLALAYYHDGVQPGSTYIHSGDGIEWISVLALFIFSILQIRVGVQLRSRFLVNTATVAIAVIIATAYIKLFGSMAQTGLVFLVGGVFLIGLGVYLEKQRRALVKQIGTAR